MDLNEYRKLIFEIGDIEIDISSIAQCRHSMAELEEREKILEQIKEKINSDIRSIEGMYLKKRKMIREKYSPNASQGILSSLKPGSLPRRRAKEMRRLTLERESKIESYEELIEIIDDLMVQIEDAKIPVRNCIKERLSL
ncbi:MAG: hypothetical protein FJ150_05760 [Euryarchaeota archaeon]|nr:hypothetical protein [Euryarchaeota archaeon]